MRGFLQSVSTETLAYYWNQGWPQELLLYLLVQRVEIASSAGGPPLVLRNYPDSGDPDLREVKRFGCWLRSFLARNPRIENVPGLEDVGPQLSRNEVSDVAKLVQIAKEGLLITKVADKDLYQLQRRRTDLLLKLDDPKPDPAGDTSRDETCDGLSFDPPKPAAGAAGTKAADASRQQQPYEQVPAEGKISATLTDSTTVTLVLRSPEGLVYYLGELMRVANRKDDSPKVPYFCLQGHSQPLFVARPAGSDRCIESLLEADAGRGRFSIPAPGQSSELAECKKGEIRFETATKCEPGRSMQALRLLSQLMSLQKSAKDLPSTAVVRVIN
jgi:hypothetical protein